MATERTITLADPSGEVVTYTHLGETGVKGRGGRTTGYKDAWVTVFQGALAAVSADRSLTRTELRVWLAALARATVETPEWDANPREIGEALGMPAREVSRTVSRLVAAGLLQRPSRGKLSLAPNIAWRGTTEARERALKSRKDDA